MKQLIGLQFFLCTVLFGTGAGFLSIPATAEAMARGDHPLASSFSALNPAGNRKVAGQPLLNMSYGSWLADAEQMTITYATDRFDGTVVVKGRYVGLSDLELRTETPTDDPLGYFESFGANVEIQYTRRLHNLQLGLGMKATRLQLYTAGAKGYALDVGVLYTVNKTVDVGVTILNMGGFESWGLRNPSFPLRVIGGIGASLESLPMQPSFMLSAENSSLTDGIILRVGDELIWKQLVVRSSMGWSKEVFVRSAGIGIRLGMYSINYGFQVGSQHLGIPHLIDVSVLLP